MNSNDEWDKYNPSELQIDGYDVLYDGRKIPYVMESGKRLYYGSYRTYESPLMVSYAPEQYDYV